MDRGRKAMPSSNRTVSSRYVQRSMEIHKKKLQNIKSHIDMSTPKSLNHAKKRNPKKEQMTEERYAQIEHENRILLQKMSEIMSKDTLDNKSDAIHYVKSLNREARKKELQRVTQENQKILQRIQSVEPAYDHSQWEQEAKQAEDYVRNISEYKDAYVERMRERQAMRSRDEDDDEYLG